MATPEDIGELQKTFYSLYQKLNDAYWAASTTEAKDQIHGARDVVDEILDVIDRRDLETDNDAIISLTQPLKAAIQDLADLQKQLDKIVHNVAIATSCIKAIDKALMIAGKIVPLAAGAI